MQSTVRLPRTPRSALLIIAVAFSAGNVVAQEPKYVLPLGDRVNCIAFSPNNKLLVAATGNKISAWDPNKGKMSFILVGHLGQIRDLSFSRDGKRLASASLDSSVRIWNVATGRVEQILRGHAQGAECVAFFPDGKRLATGGRDKAIRVWQIGKSKELIKIPSANPRGPTCLCVSPNGKSIASAGFDSEVKVWDAATGRQTLTIANKPAQHHWYRLAFNSDGDKLIAAGNGFKICETKSGKELFNRMSQSVSNRGLAVSADDNWIVTGGSDNLVIVYDVAVRKEIASLRGHDNIVTSVAISADAKLIASASDDKTVRIWNADDSR